MSRRRLIAALITGAAMIADATLASAMIKPPPRQPGVAAAVSLGTDGSGSDANAWGALHIAVNDDGSDGETMKTAAIRLTEPIDAVAMDALAQGLARHRLAQEPGAQAQAAERFKRAAHADAGRVALAYVLGFGLGVERDEPRARSMLLDVRDPYRARAWYLLGLMDERSAAPKRNARARSWFSCAARAGDGLALNHLGVLLEKAQRDREANRLYDAAARHGIREGADNQERLREATQERVVRGDFPRLRARARAGDRDAMFALGRAFHRGQDVAADYTEALRWYRLAAQKGHPEARRMLTLIVARPLTDWSVDPPWMNHLSRHRADPGGGLSLSASEQRPLAERDPLQGLETLHLQPFVPTHCEVTP